MWRDKINECSTVSMGINLVFKSKHPPSLSRMFVYDGTRRGQKIDKGVPRYEHLHLATFPSLERIRGYCLIRWPLAGGCDCVLERYISTSLKFAFLLILCVL